MMLFGMVDPLETEFGSLAMLRIVVLITRHNRLQLQVTESTKLEGLMVRSIEQRMATVLYQCQKFPHRTWRKTGRELEGGIAQPDERKYSDEIVQVRGRT